MSLFVRLTQTLTPLLIAFTICACGNVSSVENNSVPDTSVPAEDDIFIPDVSAPNTPDLGSSEDVPAVQEDIPVGLIDSGTPDTSVSDSGNSSVDSAVSEDLVCVPDCQNGALECGPDGCGGSCGECGPTLSCLDGVCACVPDCSGKSCGSDGCGGSCGSCAIGPCKPNGKCECAAICAEKECGDSYPAAPTTGGNLPNAIEILAYCDGACGRCINQGINFGSICNENGETSSCGCPQSPKQGLCEENSKDCGRVCSIECGDCPGLGNSCNEYNECEGISATPFP